MALNEIEYVGNDRYFKYRYANETTINCSMLENLKDWKSDAQFQFMAEYLKRFLNIKLDFENISYNDRHNVYNNPNLFKKSQVIAIKESSSFFRTRLDHFYPSPPVGINKLIIVSSPQVTVTSTFWSFLNMDTEAVILIILTLVFLSILLVIHSIVTNKYKSVPTKKVVKKMTLETLENVWENASLLCAEPLPAVLPHITFRLLASSWLIGVTFILFFLGCYLRTDFSTESYNFIDTLSDLIKSGIEPAFLRKKDCDYIKDLAVLDPVIKEWLVKFDDKKEFKFYNHSVIDSFIPVFSGEKALIVDSEDIISWFKKFDFQTRYFFVRKGGIYFSKQYLNLNYKHFIFNTTWIRSTPQLNVQLMVEPMFEKQVFKYQKKELRDVIGQITWKRPSQRTVELDLSSVSVPFNLLLTLLSITVAVVITEIIFK